MIPSACAVRPGDRCAAARSFVDKRADLALFKTDDLEVMRLVLTAGKSLPVHKVAGEITIQCIEGRIDVTLNGESRILEAGHLIYLARDVVHGVMAIEDASVLVTIALLR